MNILLIRGISNLADIEARKIFEVPLKQLLLHLSTPEVGSSIKVGIPNGPKGVGTIIKINSTSVSLEVDFDYSNKDSASGLSFIVGVPRSRMVRRLVYNLSTLGCRHLYFVSTEKGEKSYLNSSALLPEALDEYIYEGAEQAGITSLMTVSVSSLDVALKRISEIERNRPSGLQKVVLQPYSEHTLSSYSDRASVDIQNNEYIVGVGPESGWSNAELDKFVQADFSKVGLGGSILRVETAAVFAAGVLFGSINRHER